MQSDSHVEKVCRKGRAELRGPFCFGVFFVLFPFLLFWFPFSSLFFFLFFNCWSVVFVSTFLVLFLFFCVVSIIRYVLLVSPSVIYSNYVVAVVVATGLFVCLIF